MQFAIAAAVAPEPRAICRLTSRFRERALDEFARRRSGDSALRWRRASNDVINRLASLSGLGVDRAPLRDAEHACFVAWFRGRVPERLLVWRASVPFDSEEQSAILTAARFDLSWGAIPRDDAWSVRLVPLDPVAAPPPGFDSSTATSWSSMTPYVPPRHRFRRSGREGTAEDVESQIRRGLRESGLPYSPEFVSIDLADRPRWTAVHVPPGKQRENAFIGDRAGVLVRLCPSGKPSPVPSCSVRGATLASASSDRSTNPYS